jgi:hypothetical protein
VQDTTLEQFIPTYLAFLHSQRNPDGTTQLAPSYLRETARYAKQVVEILGGDLFVAAINPMHVLAVRQVIGEEQEHRTAFNRCRVFLSQLCLHAERCLIRPVSTNPTSCVPPYHEVWRTDQVPPEKRRRYVDAVHACVREGLVTVNAGALLLLMFFAALRWSDARLLRWDEVVVRGKRLHLQLKRRGPQREKSKGKGASIPLNQSSIDVLLSLPRGERAVWVAPNPKTGRPYTEIRGQRAHVYERAGLGVNECGWTKGGYHPLRHAAGTAAGEAGLTQKQIATLLGQRYSSSAERYVKFEGEPAVAMAAAMEAALLGVEVDHVGVRVRGIDSDEEGASAGGRTRIRGEAPDSARGAGLRGRRPVDDEEATASRAGGVRGDAGDSLRSAPVRRAGGGLKR